MSTTVYQSTGYLSTGHRHPRWRRIWQLTVVAACVGALLVVPTVVPRPVLAADTTRPAPAVSTGPPVPVCGEAAVPAGVNPPRTVYLAVTGRFVAAGSSRWCTGAPGTGNVGYVWLVLLLDRTWVARSDVCQVHRCAVVILLDVPTHPLRARDGTLCGAICDARFSVKVARTGTTTVTITTSRLGLGTHDFGQAFAFDGDLKFGTGDAAWYSVSV